MSELEMDLAETRRGQVQAQKTLMSMTQMVLLLRGSRGKSGRLDRSLPPAPGDTRGTTAPSAGGANEAQALRLEAHLQSERYRRALRADHLPVTLSHRVHDVAPPRLELDECDRVLALNARHLQGARRELYSLRLRLGMPAVDQTRVVRGQVLDPEEVDKEEQDRARQRLNQGFSAEQTAALSRTIPDDEPIPRRILWIPALVFGVPLLLVVCAYWFARLSEGEADARLEYASGSVSVGENREGKYMGLGGRPTPDRTTFTWTFEGPIKTNFRPRTQEGTHVPERAHGNLVGKLRAELPSFCTDARLRWQIQADGTTVDEGTAHGSAPAAVAIDTSVGGAGTEKITVTADARPGEGTLPPRDPVVTGPAHRPDMERTILKECFVLAGGLVRLPSVNARTVGCRSPWWWGR
ncbi:hypothetical protein [Streptomyces flavidovirens]|uniref:hypothetical protein n=1 Tax=Streptomyces flavidovirens TaxID=67298 RepID=UPI0012FE9477|nr:hypothetical protein [Streptomyces flavidovirens]